MPDKKLKGFPLTLRARKDYVLVAEDAGERTAWLRVLRHNATLPPLAGLDGLTETSERGSDGGGGGEAKGGADGKKMAKKGSRIGSMALRAEDYLVTRAVTSELGKKLLRDYCIPET